MVMHKTYSFNAPSIRVNEYPDCLADHNICVKEDGSDWVLEFDHETRKFPKDKHEYIEVVRMANEINQICQCGRRKELMCCHSY